MLDNNNQGYTPPAAISLARQIAQMRILESEIAELEERLRRLRFAAATIARHTPTAG